MDEALKIIYMHRLMLNDLTVHERLCSYNKQTNIKYRGKWLHWEKKRGCVYNDITKRGNERTSHQGQHIRKF